MFDGGNAKLSCAACKWSEEDKMCGHGWERKVRVCVLDHKAEKNWKVFSWWLWT